MIEIQHIDKLVKLSWKWVKRIVGIKFYTDVGQRDNNFMSIGRIFLNRIHAISTYAKSNWMCSKKKVNVNVSARCTVGWIFEESWPAVCSMWAADWHSSVLPHLHAAKFTRLLSMTSRQRKTLRYISSSREDTFCKDFCYSIVASPHNITCYFAQICYRNVWTGYAKYFLCQ